MKQIWNSDADESPLSSLASLHRDPLYMVVMKTYPNDVFNLCNTNKRFKGLFCGTDERAKGFRVNYVTQHRKYKWGTLHEEVLLMWIESLIENTDWASSYDNSAIRYAAYNGHVEVVRLLLNTPNRGIDPSANDNLAIFLAASNGRLDVLRLLLNTPYRGIDPAVNNNQIIIYAARNGHLEVVRLLLNTPDRGIDPVAYDNAAIRWAAANGHLEVVRLLLNTPNRGIDPVANNNYAILYAAINGYLEVVQLLLESGRVDPEGIQNKSEKIEKIITRLQNKK